MLTEENLGFVESGPVPKHNDPEAIKRFKAAPTYYGSGRICSYGDKTKVCDPSCRFWNTCIKGRHREGKKCTE